MLRDMWQETKTPLVVYATEDALNTPRAPLSGPLERFVKADNKTFRQELNQEQSQVEQSTAPAAADLVSPSKRKHRSDSMDSMDSNRASQGSIEMDDREDPFVTQFDGPSSDLLGQEMQEQPSGGKDEPSVAGDQSFALMGLQEPMRKGTDDSIEGAGQAVMTTEEADSSTTNGTSVPTPSTSTQAGGFSRTMSPEADVTRSPEMQERSRPPTFMTSSSSEGDKSRGVGTMEMEVPEHQD